MNAKGKEDFIKKVAERETLHKKKQMIMTGNCAVWQRNLICA